MHYIALYWQCLICKLNKDYILFNTIISNIFLFYIAEHHWAKPVSLNPTAVCLWGGEGRDGKREETQEREGKGGKGYYYSKSFGWAILWQLVFIEEKPSALLKNALIFHLDTQI